jgi:tetratricopeptide (TPR) repeat protein
MLRFADCLLRLHRQIADGQGDSDAADILRDQLDVLSGELSESDDSLLRGLSADLYTLGQTLAASPPVDVGLIAQFQHFEAAEDWPALLASLRTAQSQIAVHYAQFMRGVCWAQLGQLDVGIAFLRDASRLAPTESTVKTWLLAVMMQANRTADALALAESIDPLSTDVELLLTVAITLFVAAEQSPFSEAESAHGRAIAAADRAIHATLKVQLTNSARHSLFTVYLHKSLSHDHLNQMALARNCCAKAIELYPHDAAAKLLQDWLRRNEPDAAAEFRRNLGISITRNDFLTLSAKFDPTGDQQILN